jgi:CMP-N-acetylneuraminic acid synthetase
VIDTDSATIEKYVTQTFPDVQLISRPENLRAGTVPMNDVLLYDVRQVEADFYLQTHSTNPLLRTETISHAVETYLNKLLSYDTLFSVTGLQVRLWDKDARPINHNPAVLQRTQDLAPVFEENSNLYIFPRNVLEERGTRIGERPLMFQIDRMEAWDIDEEMDFEIAEFLYLNRLKGGDA